MKLLLNIIRVLVGVLFIFSGLVKANDPLGLSYKMEEFFAAWNWNWAFAFSLFISVSMIAFEIIAGVALLLGWKQKLFGWLLLLLTIFFTFLTGYAVLSGKFKSCGCFGDCLPLTSKQSFIKDLILLVLVFFLFTNRKKILPLFNNIRMIWLMFFTAAIAVLGQLYLLKHLPVKDCLPYAAGKDLLKQMQPGPKFQPENILVSWAYNHNGKLVKFDSDHFPDDFNDTTYTDGKREDKIISEAIDDAPIKDFLLKTLSGTDTTKEILNQQNKYVLFFIKNFDGNSPNWENKLIEINNACKNGSKKLILISSNGEQVNHYFNETKHLGLPVLICDATVMKTFLRSDVGIVLMDKSTVVNKFNITDYHKAIDAIK